MDRNQEKGEQIAASMEDEMMTSTAPMAPIDWKLYHNPHYSHRRPNSPNRKQQPYTCITKSRSSYHTDTAAAFARAMDRGDDDVNLSDLDTALAEIKDLRAELEFERRMRRKVEALNEAMARELAEERRARAAAEDRRREMEEEAVIVRRAAERVAREVEDERRMLVTAEAMREERVQMKLAEARVVMEEKMKEMMAAAAAAPGVGRERKEAENPHIKRGMKGMEFPRAARVRGSPPPSREGQQQHHLGSNLECQRAQLRVLMRHKSPGGGSGLISSAQNLVM